MSFLYYDRKVARASYHGGPKEIITVQDPRPLGWIIVGLLILALISAVGVGGCSGIKAYSRAQKRADANNAVKITSINIRKAQQQARIVRAQNAAVAARAQQRYIEAVGIRRAQDEISKTLTPLYVQHEAIQAQERIATSGRNNTVIYVPSGGAGTPLITQDAGGLTKAPPTGNG